MGYIAVDLDGTLALYDVWKGMEHIGEPVQPMLERVRKWIGEGKKVKIFTARASMPGHEKPIQEWLKKHGIGGLEITNVKDFEMEELWDDRAMQVVCNQGISLDEQYRELLDEIQETHLRQQVELRNDIVNAFHGIKQAIKLELERE